MGLLIGFTTIIVVIACGSGLAHAGVLTVRSQRALGEIAFFVASPALMIVTISEVESPARSPTWPRRPGPWPPASCSTPWSPGCGGGSTPARS